VLGDRRHHAVVFLNGDAATIIGPSSGLARSGFAAMLRVGHGKSNEIAIEMIIGLSKTRRLRAGWFVALSYLLCVLAPTISYALPGEHAVAHCLTDENHVPGMIHVHNEMPAQHVHKDGQVHDHSGKHLHANSDSDHGLMSMALDRKSVPEKAPHSSDGQCCGLMCITALPATLIDIVKPSALTALCEIEGYRKVTDNAPPRLYRPPIS
jgi:hypothetical protein